MADLLFPAELVDKVLECACDDIAVSTLKASSLVSRQWRAISRPYLFRRVTISTEASLQNFVLFVSDDMAVARYVHALIIRPRRPNGLIKPSPWIAMVSSRLPSMLGNLQAVELVHLYELGENINARFIEGFSKFTSVRTLTFRSCSIDVALIQALVSALPILRTLIISSVSPLMSEIINNIPHLRSPRLVAMDLYFSPTYPDAMRSFLPWIEASETRETLRSFSVTTRVQDGDSVGHCILEVAPRIEELGLEMENFLGLPLETTVIKQRINIGSCTNLRSLMLFDENPTSAAILGLLSEVNSPFIRKITLPVSAHSTHPDEFPNLSALDESLSSRALKSVEAFCIKYSGGLELDIVSGKLQEYLPSTHARGILQVVRSE